LRSPTLALLAGLTIPAALNAQRGHDLQLHAIGMVGGREFAGAGAGAGLRFGRGLRAALGVSGGWIEPGRAAGRAELLATFHLAPFSRAGPTVYGGGGVAALAADSLRGYLVLLVGLEARPAAGGGWFAEAGVGGGMRLAIGYRAISYVARRR
jgi:hypothetical protein